MIGYGECRVCGQWGYLFDGACAAGHDARVASPTTPPRAPARVAAPRCDCGAAAADPVSTRRDGGPGHAGYCTVRGQP